MYGPRTSGRFTSFRDVVRSKTEQYTSSNVDPISSFKRSRKKHEGLEAVSRLTRVRTFWNKLSFMTGNTTSINTDMIMDIARDICKDYIHQKLSLKGYSTRKIKFHPTQCKYSEHFVKTGRVLERLYPKVYSDVSRKICITMTSPTIVKNTLSSVFEIMFREDITWGKIVSMFAISACFAEECFQQGHSEFVDDIINCVGNFVALHLVEWLVKEGGWESFEQAVVGSNSVGMPIIVGVFTALVGVVTTLAFIIDFS